MSERKIDLAIIGGGIAAAAAVLALKDRGIAVAGCCPATRDNRHAAGCPAQGSGALSYDANEKGQGVGWTKVWLLLALSKASFRDS
jgi:succinate dehydrogenase/fumarate reductase flavoprotein subunit